MASFAEGLASGLSGLPQALLYRQEQDRKDAYKKDIAGLSSADSPFDYEAAARVALKHGDTDSALALSAHGGGSQGRGLLLGSGSRGLTKLKPRIAPGSMPPRMRRRSIRNARGSPAVLPRSLKAGDTDQMGRMIATHPGLIGGLMNFGPVAARLASRRPKRQTVKRAMRSSSGTRARGRRDRRLQMRARTPGDTVVSYSQEQIERALQPFQPADKVDKPTSGTGADGRNYWVTPDGQSSPLSQAWSEAAEERREAAHPPEGRGPGDPPRG